MVKKLNWSLKYFVFVFAVLIFMGSCVPQKKLVYFNDINELTEPVVNPRTQKTIKPFDELYIRVLSIDPQTSQIFNPSTNMNMGAMSTNLVSYLVDEEGNVDFPFVGNINVLSLTTSDAADKIETALSDYVSNISVAVKFIDNRVTVVGQVQTQGVYNFTQDKITVYDAIGLGGGITNYGDRKNVVLIRNEGDRIMHYQLDLSDSQIAQKPQYYIYPNDIIVVEPIKAISSSYSNITYTTILSSITTAIAVLLFMGVSFNN